MAPRNLKNLTIIIAEPAAVAYQRECAEHDEIVALRKKLVLEVLKMGLDRQIAAEAAAALKRKAKKSDKITLKLRFGGKKAAGDGSTGGVKKIRLCV
jgi:hypothetical protein